MKIQLQSPLALPANSSQSDKSRNLFEQWVGLVKSPNTQIVKRYLSRGISSMEQYVYNGFRYFNCVDILKCMVKAEQDGYDAVIGICWLDPAIDAAKQLLDIPVIGPAKTSMHFACLVGDKIAVVTSDDRFIPDMNRLIKNYNMSNNMIQPKSVRSLTLATKDILDCITNNHLPIIEDFINVCKTCIEDGADVIIIGCGIIAPIISTSGIRYVNNVPILDPVLISIKIAELLVNLKGLEFPIISRNGLYYAPAKKDIGEVLNVIDGL